MSAVYTTLEKINIAKVSEYICQNAITKAGLNADGIDRNLPRKIYLVRKNVEWLYLLDNNDSTLFSTSTFMLGLCAPYSFLAANITNSGSGGTVSPVNPSSAPNPIEFEVTGSSFIVDGQGTSAIGAFEGFNLLFLRNNIPQSTVNNGGTYFSWDKQTAQFQCFPAATATELFQLYPF